MCRKGALHTTGTDVTLRKENLICLRAVFQISEVNVMAVDLMIHIPFLLCLCISDSSPVTVSIMCPSGDISLNLEGNVMFYLLKYSDHKTKRALTGALEWYFQK